MNNENLYVVLKIDPYQSNIPNLILFSNIKKSKEFIMSEVIEMLEFQTETVSGLKGNKDTHIKNYQKFLDKYNMLYYYGEYKDYYNMLEMDPYEIKYVIEEHSVN